MSSKFKKGDIVVINAPEDKYESQYNGKKAKVIDLYIGFAGLEQNYVSGTWYVPKNWLKLSNSHIIKKRLGIK